MEEDSSITSRLLAWKTERRVARGRKRGRLGTGPGFQRAEELTFVQLKRKVMVEISAAEPFLHTGEGWRGSGKVGVTLIPRTYALLERGQDGRAPGNPRAPKEGEELAEKTKGEQMKDTEDPDEVGSQKLRGSKNQERSQVNIAERSRRGLQRENHSQLQESSFACSGRQNPITGSSDRGAGGLLDSGFEREERSPQGSRIRRVQGHANMALVEAGEDLSGCE